MTKLMNWLAPVALGFASAGLVAGAASAAEHEPIPVEILAGSCSACHGPGGRSPGAIPTIAGKSYDSLIESLRGFKSGEIAATVMNRHAKGYTDEELEALARHYSSQN